MNNMMKTAGIVAALSITSWGANAAIWSSTEAHFTYGKLDQPFSGGAERDTTILTLQHASGWKYGDNFFFIDYLNYSGDNGNSGNEFYGEWYSNFSLGAITGNEIKFGPVKDIGLIVGANFAPDVQSMWYLPGVRFDLDLPGFAFAHLDVTSYIHSGFSSTSKSFHIKDEDNSFMVDFNWAYPFKIGNASWSIEGHIEYIDGRDQVTNFGPGKVSSWVLAQPQIRLDLGELMGNEAGNLFVGLELQYWNNKLGDKDTDEKAAQALLVWNF